MDPVRTLFVILFLPLLSAVLIAALGRRRGAFSATLATASSAFQAILALWLLWTGWDGTPIVLSKTWMELGQASFSLGILFDNTAALMLFVVTFVGFWIHLFSLGYMADDPARGRFWGGMSIFMFSMTGLVVADNLVMMFIFWELVGFSSYMLIGHYFHRPAAAAAANKAFIVNRVGDFGFLLGIIWCYWQYGTVSLPELEAIGLHSPHLLLTPISLLLIGGVLGKSAQVPLHVWLPDAMEGPTPVSALIHAATMVAAGVYLLARIYFLYTMPALEAIILIGTVTAVYAAACAFAVSDIKKILAYSTLSQLGFLVAAFGLGTQYGLMHPEVGNARLFGVGASNFHLTTHAFFKALLFLGAGAMIHACHHQQDIFRMGGLWKRMPVTFATMTIAVLAIAGIPPLAGFWSKDAILYIASLHQPAVFGLLCLAALLTALYMGRLYFTAFFGEPKTPEADHASERGWVMVLPLLVLAAYSSAGGWMALYPPALHFLLYDSVLHPTGAASTIMLWVSIAAGAGGLALAFVIYGLGSSEDRVSRRAPGLFALLRSRLFFDEIYGFYVKGVQQRVAEILSFLDQLLIGGLLVRGSAGLAGLVGVITRSGLVGNLQGYTYWFLGGVVLFWAYAMGLF